MLLHSNTYLQINQSLFLFLNATLAFVQGAFVLDPTLALVQGAFVLDPTLVFVQGAFVLDPTLAEKQQILILPITFHTQGEHASHYTTNVVYKINNTSFSISSLEPNLTIEIML